MTDFIKCLGEIEKAHSRYLASIAHASFTQTAAEVEKEGLENYPKTMSTALQNHTVQP